MEPSGAAAHDRDVSHAGISTGVRGPYDAIAKRDAARYGERPTE
jgi:hypothetical protein